MTFRDIKIRKELVLVFILCLALTPSSVQAVPAIFNWGSYHIAGSTDYGVYDSDNTSILQTGDLVQLIWVGPNGMADVPSSNGSPGGDDLLLDQSSVNNGLPLPPPQRDRGYIPSNDYTFDTESPQAGGMVYIRSWNASSATMATAYGDSSTKPLSNGESWTALRWHTNEVVSMNRIYLPMLKAL